jgi:hypothetical protein
VVTARSPIHTMLTVSIGAATVSQRLEPDKFATFVVPAAGVKGLNSYAHLLTVRSSEGFTPKLRDASSRDERNLGVQMHFKAVLTGTP